MSSFLAVRDEVVCGEADVFGDLPDQARRNVAASMIWHRGTPAVRVPKLLVRPALSDLYEAERFQNRDDFTRPKGWNAPHGL